MRVIYNFDDTDIISKAVATIGSFDGVHQGHREILSFIRAEASRRGGESTVITFDPHPRSVLEGQGGIKQITSLHEKLSLIEGQMIDNVIIVRFDKSFSTLSAHDFVQNYLIGRLHIDTLMVGYNHHLGHNKEANAHSLQEIGHSLGFRVVEMPQCSVDNHKVSSTIIRQMIECGDIAQANHYMGSTYTLSGSLTPEGIFTVYEPLKIMPPQGEYMVDVIYGKNQSTTSINITSEGIIKTNLNKKFTQQTEITFKFLYLCQNLDLTR